jgi:hypothetical protein
MLDPHAGIILGVVVVFVALGIGILVQKPISRIPPAPPGYYEWLRKTSKNKEE